MKQNSLVREGLPISDDQLKGMKEDALKKLGELEKLRINRKITGEVYQIFHKGLEGIIAGKVKRVA